MVAAHANWETALTSSHFLIHFLLFQSYRSARWQTPDYNLTLPSAPTTPSIRLPACLLKAVASSTVYCGRGQIVSSSSISILPSTILWNGPERTRIFGLRRMPAFRHRLY